MNPTSIESGAYAGSGIVVLSADHQASSPISVSINVVRHIKSLEVSGNFRVGTRSDSTKFTAVIESVPLATKPGKVTASIDGIGNMHGVVTSESENVLLSIVSKDNSITATQRWDAVRQRNCFKVTGIILQLGGDSLQYRVTFGPADPRQVQSNVVSIDSSA